jgi:serine/threonine protein kinase
LGLLHCRYIVKLVGLIETPELLAIATEYCMGGDLNAYVVGRGTLAQEEARLYFAQLLTALSYLHGKNMVHRDIKLSNLTLLERKPDWREQEIRLIDFGLVATDAVSVCLAPFSLSHPSRVIGQDAGHLLWYSRVRCTGDDLGRRVHWWCC